MTAPPRRLARLVTPFALSLVVVAPTAWAADPAPRTPLTIQRAAGPIVLDGELSDAGWQGITPDTTWYETNPGDNIPPPVRNAAWLAYDDQYFYAAFRFEDPRPRSVRAPIGDHDAVPGSTDYAGVIVDSRHDGKTAQMFLANPHGVQYDAVTSDATGEDSSPDFFWDAVGRMTDTGWNLEIRIPFSSLRYSNESDPTWGILLYRNYPRDRRYQFFTSRLPRDVNCFICNSSPLVGLTRLPHGAHLVLAPFATAQQQAFPSGGPGSSLHAEDVKTEAGLDLKFAPASSAVIDATLNPDFSQVESDAAQIVANERFALFFPEKRPFFLEGVDLLSTPMTAVYTRTMTAPRAGVRATGKVGETAYTALVTHDRGGGLVILPGPQGSGFAEQDYTSEAGVVRVRRDLGRSFVSLLGTARVIDGPTLNGDSLGRENQGHNVVFGPDFQWRPKGSEAITGQALWSHSATPHRPDLASEWDGRTLSDHAFQLGWSHGTPHVDWYLQGQDIGEQFRADNGFMPQVGYREGYAEAGYTVRPQHAFLSRIRFFTVHYLDVDRDGRSLNQRVSAGAGMDGRWNSFLRIELNRDAIRVGSDYLPRFRPRIQIQANPSRVFNQLSLDTFLGEEIDFANGRRGSGFSSTASATVRPGDHVELRADASLRELYVQRGRLFNAQVERLRGTYSFSARSFLRLIGQYVETRRDPDVYLFTVDRKTADFSTSALFAYKLNWQTVFYAGYGDDRSFEPLTDALENSSRQWFAKISYAWQR